MTDESTDDGVKITITTGLWVAWAQVAADAYARAVDQRSQGGLSSEMAEAMTSICAAGFAVEALVMALVSETDSELAERWKNSSRPPKAASRVHEVLKRSVTLRGPEVDSLASRWTEVISKRNDVVHFDEEGHEPVAHATGVLSSQEVAAYTVEAAGEAVGLLVETLVAVRDQGKPSLKGWLPLWSGAIDEIEQRSASSTD